ncbi:pantoate--beta-alanine ligase [Dokdonella sp.]|uniref:pantoate--beta-alanine ligase n=1 Tax=Dokdonella sp. TaxID=2291710 RepID=UPI001B0CB713|nr:pantoate--beta-alanine ligase [Dokdonella sp.]MBO9662382.1 pantoate--beta-alanine ligase [Dokdonella sp.]
MEIVRRNNELYAVVDVWQRAGKRIALVPTMGNLHAGHHSLITLARERADVVIASVFVNPTQFGPHEDFARYPRTPDADAAGLAASGCDLLFLPGVEDLYPYGADRSVRVSVPELTGVLEGAIRPGHFDGVATVVAKLFNLARPHVAVFGQKDYQQLLVIRRLARDLGYPIEIVAAPIVREENGLAMSSRNQYLDADQRARASAINVALRAMDEHMRGARPRQEVEAEASRRLTEAGLQPDYAVIRRAADLAEPSPDDRQLVALIAARMGQTRLIDNLLIDL